MVTAGYTKFSVITIDHTKVSGSTNFTDFPVLISGTYDGTGGEPDLRHTSNGGDVTHSSGYDIEFSSDAEGNSDLAHEIEFYSSSTGQLIAHVKVPTLNATAATEIYLWYGNSNVSASTEDKTGTWHSRYLTVYHLNEASGGIADSTANADDMTTIGSGGTYQSTGKIYRGVATAGTRGFRKSTFLSNLTDDDYVTMEAVVNVTSFTTNGMIFFHGDFGYMFIRFDSGSPNKLLVYALLQNSTYYNITNANASWVTGTWFHIFARFRKNDNLYLQVNGSDITTAAVANFNLKDEGSLNAAIGNYESSQYFNGTIDEVRLITGDVGADYGKTSYETLFNPNTFYSMGTGQDVGGGGTETSDSRGAHTTGSVVTSSNRSAHMVGEATATSSRNAHLIGQATISNSRGAHITGEQTINSSRSVRLTGANGVNSSRSAVTTGQHILSIDLVDISFTSGSGASSSRNAHLTGTATTQDSRASHLSGSIDTSSHHSATLTGTDTVSDNRAATLTGSQNIANSRSSHLTGTDTNQDSRGAQITGVQGASSSRSATIHGTAATSDGRAGHITGIDTATAGRNARLSGEVQQSSNRSGKLTGTDTATDSRSAHLTGNLTASAARDARMTGTQSTSSSRGAKVPGLALAEDSRNVRLTGGIDQSTSRNATLYGAGQATGSRGCRLKGKPTYTAKYTVNNNSYEDLYIRKLY